MKWSALHDAAETVAMIAGIEGKAMTAQARNFPVIMREAGGSLRELAEQGMEDLTAMMEPGLSALLAAHARGADSSPAASALWQEFLSARDALMKLAPEKSADTAMRST
ncbi:MAG: hypothetical protein KUG65_04540 [Sphingomonadaceae bacterium]|nr:hypothetical protein [Sphingomonadaceae bacterium]